MSTLAYAPARPRIQEPVAPQRPLRRVEIVPSRVLRRARPKPVYAVVAIAGLFALFLAQLLLSIAVSDGAYHIAKLQAKKTSLVREQQSLTEQSDVLSSTQNLAAKAAALGMVPSGGTPAFLDLATGSVVGESTAASGSAAGAATLANSLLPDAPADTRSGNDTATSDTATSHTATTDDARHGADAAGAGTAAGASTSSGTAGLVGAGSADGAVDGGGAESADESQASLSTSGAPAGSAVTANVPSSEGGLPTPTTH